MANIKDPSGSFYLDSSEFNVDYAKNKISLVGGPGDEGAITVDGGMFNANAVLAGEDELTIEVSDAGESATVGITPNSIVLTHNTNSTSDGSVRVTANAVEFKAGTNTVQINGTGVDFGGIALRNISSIGSTSAGTAIAFEENLDMNGHIFEGLGTTTVADATNATDVIAQLNALLAQLRAIGIIPNA